MAHQAIGLLETRGLVALVEGADAMLKAANVELAGAMTQVGNALVTAVVVGDVAAVKAATDAGAQAIKAIKGELVMFCQGSSARLAPNLKDAPVDAVIIGIVDTVDVMGKEIYNART